MFRPSLFAAHLLPATRLLTAFLLLSGAAGAEPIKIGLITPLTGPLAAFAPGETTVMAIEEINQQGGIGGRPVQLIIEDGKADGRAAASAAQKLIGIDKVHFILGGQSSAEMLAIAPIAERSKVVAIGSMASSPDISKAGDFIFRTTTVSSLQGELLANYAYGRRGLRTAALLAEESPYAVPILEAFRRKLTGLGGRIISETRFDPGDTDFRSVLAPLKSRSPEVILITAQSLPLAELLMRQMRELKFASQVLAGETIGNIPTVRPQTVQIFEGVVFAQPAFDIDQPAARQMIERYKQRYNQPGLKYPYQLESYDAAMILAKTIRECGDDPVKVKDCLYEIKDYPGVSGKITFDANGDVLRPYVLKTIRAGKVAKLE